MSLRDRDRQNQRKRFGMVNLYGDLNQPTDKSKKYNFRYEYFEGSSNVTKHKVKYYDLLAL